MSGPSPNSLITSWNKGRGQSFDTDKGTQGYTGPSAYDTGFSTTTGGVTTLDPTIRDMRNSSLADYLASTLQTRNQFLGNQSGFVNSILNPLRASAALQQGQLQRSLGQRGLSGSSFGDQALTNLTTTNNRSIADAQAQAQMQNASALSQIDQARFEAQNTVAQQTLQQELAALGLSQTQIAQMMDAFQQQQLRTQENQKIVNKMLVDQDSSARGWYGSIMGSLGKGTPKP
jgi:hypothetical protein